MARLLTVDPSTHCGWAHGAPGSGERALFGVQSLPAGPEWSVKMCILQDFLVSLIKGNGITEVVIEKPILPKVTQFESVAQIVGVATVVAMTARRCGATSTLVDQQTWRSGFMGVTQAPKMNDEAVMAVLIDVRDKREVSKFLAVKGEAAVKNRRARARRKWLKDFTIRQCRLRGYDVSDDNAADAIGIYEHVAASRLRRDAQPQLDLTHELMI